MRGKVLKKNVPFLAQQNECEDEKKSGGKKCERDTNKLERKRVKETRTRVATCILTGFVRSEKLQQRGLSAQSVFHPRFPTRCIFFWCFVNKRKTFTQTHTIDDTTTRQHKLQLLPDQTEPLSPTTPTGLLLLSL